MTNNTQTDALYRELRELAMSAGLRDVVLGAAILQVAEKLAPILKRIPPTSVGDWGIFGDVSEI